MGVIPWSPLHGGLLGGVLKKEKEGRRRQGGQAQETLRANYDKVKAYEDLCDSVGEQPANVALAWLLRQDGVTAPIIGPRTNEQLDAMQRAVKITLSSEVLEQLDRIFPGYQPAPEHYAW